MSTAATELDLRVEGMTCAACARRVKTALERVEGVRVVDVDLVRERARVSGSAVDSGALAVAAEQAGYRVTPAAAQPGAPARTPPSARRPLLALALAALATAIPFVVAPSLVRGGVELAIGALVALGLGHELFRRARSEIGARAPGMNTLVASGAAASLALHAAMLWELASASAHHAMHGGGMAHSDAAGAATIVAFVLVGRFLDARARHRVAAALDALETPLDATARVVRHGAEGEVAATDLREGDVVIVPPHGVVPADGLVLEVTGGAAALLDEAWMTGESKPVERASGAEVLAGTVNTTRAFRMRVRSAGATSRRARIAELVGRALAERSPSVERADRWSARVVPLVLVVAAGTAIALLATGHTPGEALTRAVTVLVVACPCALGLATPTAIAAALGSALRAGILVRAPSQLEALADVRTIVFDKTGTLTAGRPSPVHFAGPAPEKLLTLAAAIETESEHPLGRAIFEEAMRRGLTLPRAEDVAPIERGLGGVVDGRRVEVGAPAVEEPAMAAHREAGASIVEVRQDGVALGWIAIADALRPEAAGVVATLRASGAALRMLSGDDVRAARARGLEAGLREGEIEGGLSPDDKRARLATLANSGPVAMVGDGINDAPALAAAAVGIAIGRGARIAVETAGITIEAGLSRLVPALHLARHTRAVIHQNLLLAFAYNVVALPLAALGALDAIGGPSVAALAMALSSVAVVLSSLRLSRPLRVA